MWKIPWFAWKSQSINSQSAKSEPLPSLRNAMAWFGVFVVVFSTITGLDNEWHNGRIVIGRNCLLFQSTWIHPFPSGVGVCLYIVFCQLFCCCWLFLYFTGLHSVLGCWFLTALSDFYHNLFFHKIIISPFLTIIMSQN